MDALLCVASIACTCCSKPEEGRSTQAWAGWVATVVGVDIVGVLAEAEGVLVEQLVVGSCCAAG